MDEKIKFGEMVPNLAVFEKQILYNLRKMTVQEIATLPDVSEGLEFRIKEAANISNSLEKLISNIKTKRYTQTRIQRILVYSLLGITVKDINMSKRVTPYIRVLAFNKHGKRIISAIAANNPRIKIIVSLKKFMENNMDNNLRNMMTKDILATNIYTLGYTGNTGIANLDYTHKIIEIK
jgi:predicted nucleotidyltransferase